jgi:hypothetical protein
MPVISSEIANAILFYNETTVARVLSNAQHCPSASNINYGEILRIVATRAIHVGKVARAVDLCTQNGVRGVYEILARGLAQNTLVCDLSLALHDILTHNCWSATVHAILRAYCCFSTECTRDTSERGITKACLFARDMILVWFRANGCNADALARASNDIIKLMDDVQRNRVPTNKQIHSAIIHKLYCAIFMVITTA